MKMFALFHSVTVAIALYLVQYHGVLNWLLEKDPTKFTFLIIGVYALASIYLAFGKNYSLIGFVASTLPGIGLLGTVTGTYLLLKTGVKADDSMSLLAGMAPVFLNTGFGIGFWLLLSSQLAFCFRQYANE